MAYYIGLDGGGTKTRCVIADENLNELYNCAGGPSTFLLQGVDKVAETVFNLINECVEMAGIKFSDVASVVLGTTGAGRRSDAERMEEGFSNYLKTKNLTIKNFHVESDARIALEGAFSGGAGSILIAGTGSIMFGKDKDGEIHRVGGFGRFIGDEGSGYTLGRKGLVAVAKNMDGRGASTLLTEYLAAEHNIKESSELIIEIYKNNFDIASVAPLVIKAAEHKDEICAAIIEEEAENLLLHIRAMRKKLGNSGMKVCFVGGTITTTNYYSKLFRDKINKYLPEVIIKEEDYAPVMGAVVMAKEMSK